MNEVEVKVHEQTANFCKNLEPFTEEEMEANLNDLKNFIQKNQNSKYFMLLSNKINYYTIFTKTNLLVQGQHFAKEIMRFLTEDSFLKEVGQMKVFKRTEGNEIEIWLGETYFLLFPADSFFVEV